MNRAILEKNDAKTFFLSSNGKGRTYATVEATNKATRFTYRITRAKDTVRPRFFVSVLTGPNNTKDYTYLGQILDGQFMLTKNSKISANAPSFKAFQLVWNLLTGPNSLPDWLTIYHEGKCGCCGRLLTEPVSIKTGIGPICRGKIIKAHASHYIA